jgi:hypothetical protein
MPDVAVHDIQLGWKVFAGQELVGTVKGIDEDELVISKGWLIRHEYRIPSERIADATAGFVDLAVDPADIVIYERRG